MMNHIVSHSKITIAAMLLFFNCHAALGGEKIKADVLYYNARIYTVDKGFVQLSAFAVEKGKICWVGNTDESAIIDARHSIDMGGHYVYPGFIDAHCHFFHYGLDQKKIDLTGTTSFSEVVDILLSHKDKLFSGWLWGRGWDQNDWDEKTFPDKTLLDTLFPTVPVFLQRVDGHAALCNSLALKLCGITNKTIIAGGEVEIRDGALTGILIDNAVDSVKLKIPLPSLATKVEALLNAQKNCVAVGLTSVTDAGLDKDIILVIDSLQRVGILKMRINAMVSYSKANADYFFKRGKIKTPYLTVCSFKVYADGALGSRGACMRQPYNDKPDHYGLLLHSVNELKDAATKIAAHNFQMNTHCIGDSANHLLLAIYADALKGKANARWRIEHAQVVAPEDIKKFGEYQIIPSVQPTHATSDMYWAESRIGATRMQTAYAYNQLLKSAGIIAAGSDFPVEGINPLDGFYAATVRKDKKGYPEEAFQPADSITREEALRAMTIWAAYAAFEENEKGSIEVGKVADFVVLQNDLMTIQDKDLFDSKVLQTYINGELVYEAKK